METLSGALEETDSEQMIFQKYEARVDVFSESISMQMITTSVM